MHKVTKYNILMKFYIHFFLMKFWFILFNRTALHYAVENGDIEMVKILTECPKVDVNVLCVLNNYFA